MKHLSGSRRVFAVAGAVLLVAAASGSALAMIDPGLGGTRSEQTQRQIRQNASGQAQQSPLPTATPKPHADEVEFSGTVEVIAATGWVIGGRTVQVSGATEIGSGIDVGSEVKVHASVQPDGSLLAREIKLLNAGGDDGNSNENENENDDNGNVNSNDDNGNDDHGNDNGNVNSNDDNGNDDHGNDNGNVNSNDDNGNDDHGNDNGNVNSNDDHGGGHDDDHGSSNGNDDHGGGHD